MPRALQPPRVCRLLRLGDCGRTECCGSRLSVRLDYPSQQLVNARVLARAGPGPLTHWPWPSCGSCQLSAHRLGNGCSQCGRSAVRPACMPINRGGCVFQVCNLRGVLWLGRAARAGKWPALLCVMPCRSPTPVHCGCPPSVLCCRVCAANFDIGIYRYRSFDFDIEVSNFDIGIYRLLIDSVLDFWPLPLAYQCGLLFIWNPHTFDING